MKRDIYIGAGFVALLATLGAGYHFAEKRAVVQAADIQAPRFEVDPLWPKPLPNHWVMGSTIGVNVDAQDHVWIIHRPGTLEPKETYTVQKPSMATCCTPAPPVLAFDQEGNLIASWGGPGQGYEWPESNHGITVDYKGNVWIGGNARNAKNPANFDDNQILKFTQQGKFLMQIGHSQKSQGSNDVANLKGPAKIFIDKASNELIVADGYGNHRVIVFDAESGKYKRHWGAYGNKPDDKDLGNYNPNAPLAQQFRNPVHCADLSVDGLIYVCDRANDRLQVFTKEGKFVKEQVVAKNTLGDGSVWDIAFSKDPQQKYIYMADGANEKVYILDRQSLQILTSFGDGGRQPGQFYAVHSIATDSKGNIYTTETYRGQRVQRFLYKGLGAVSKADQGVLWPQITKK